MKVIDLLNKIANGEEVPTKIIFEGKEYRYRDGIDYVDEIDGNYLLSVECVDIYFLNDEVEILEEKEICHKCHKYPAEYNQTYCEFCLGISKLEEKKIPEKLNKQHFHNRQRQLANKINEIIDYLKSKGE